MVRQGIVAVFILAACTAASPINKDKAVRRMRRDMEYLVQHSNIKPDISVHKRSIDDSHQRANGAFKRVKRGKRALDENMIQEYVNVLEKRITDMHENRIKREVPLQRTKRVKRVPKSEIGQRSLQRVKRVKRDNLQNSRRKRETTLNRAKALVRVKRGDKQQALKNTKKPVISSQDKKLAKKKTQPLIPAKPSTVNNKVAVHDKKAAVPKQKPAAATNTHAQKPPKSSKSKSAVSKAGQHNVGTDQHLKHVVGTIITRIKKNGLQNQPTNHIRPKPDDIFKANDRQHHHAGKLERKKKKRTTVKRKQHRQKAPSHAPHSKHSNNIHTKHQLKPVHVHKKSLPVSHVRPHTETIHHHGKLHHQEESGHHHTKPRHLVDSHDHHNLARPHHKAVHTRTKTKSEHQNVAHRRQNGGANSHASNHHSQQRVNLKKQLAKINRLRREINKNVISTIRQIKDMRADRQMHRDKRANGHHSRIVSHNHYKNRQNLGHKY